MIKLLFVTIPIFLFSSYSSAFEIHRVNGELYLFDDTCESAMAKVNALDDWAKKLNSTQECLIKSPINRGDLCGFRLTNCAPAELLKNYGKFPMHDGPNCWNAALGISGILPALRYSSPEEMSFYMNSALCNPLRDGEQRKPGDIGAIREIKNGTVLEDHGFVYITDNLVYSKNEYFKTVSYQLLPLEGVYSLFSVPQREECRKNTIDEATSCKKAVSFYRCRPLSNLITEKERPMNILADLLAFINTFEIYFENINMSTGEFSLERISAFSMGVHDYMDRLNHLEPSVFELPSSIFWLKLIRWRIFSLSEQLGMTLHIRENQELLDASLFLHQYILELQSY